jgi:cation transport protein ChaC
MDLTDALLARVERVDPADVGDEEGLTRMTEAEVDAAAAGFLAANPGPLWVFAYGSLIWRPEFEFVEARPVVVHGWRRAFCIGMTSFRATPAQPGLMLALQQGGSCRGVAFRLPGDDALGRMRRLLIREGDFHESMPCFRWLAARGGGELLKVMTFYAMPRRHPWLEPLPPDQQAQRIARAAGRIGSCAAYLKNTVEHLEARGIHDPYLWDMQRRVADEIAGMAPLVQQ